MKTQQQLDEEAGIHNTTGYDRNSGSRIAGGTVDLYGKFKTDPYANGTTPAVTPFTETAGVISSKDDLRGLSLIAQNLMAYSLV